MVFPRSAVPLFPLLIILPLRTLLLAFCTHFSIDSSPLEPQGGLSLEWAYADSQTWQCTDDPYALKILSGSICLNWFITNFQYFIAGHYIVRRREIVTVVEPVASGLQYPHSKGTSCELQNKATIINTIPLEYLRLRG